MMLLRTSAQRSALLKRAATATTTLPTPLSSVVHHRRTFASKWLSVPMAPKDAILGITENFLADKSPKKINVGVGAYRDDNGVPTVLKSVALAGDQLHSKRLDNEYGPISGYPHFVRNAVSLALGADNPVIKEGRYAAVQSLSGTGALYLIGQFIHRFVGAGTEIYLPTPTWGNHIPIFTDAGLTVQRYPYFDTATRSLDLQGILGSVNQAPNGSFFLFHACAHNPTGCDPTPEQWREISAACKQKGHFLVVDSAYQGFASGDVRADAASIQTFLADGHNIALCQSFAKNFGLYGQRVGCLSVVTNDANEAARVESQLKVLARPIYSNPPIHGARIVSTILSDDALRTQWLADVKEMADRIITMRALLRGEIEAAGSTLDWSHITSQIGMFAILGLSPDQVARLTKDYHVYLTNDSRISMAGVNTKNVKYLAEAIHNVSA